MVVKYLKSPVQIVWDLSLEQHRWLFLLEQDIRSAMIAFVDYRATQVAILNPLPFGACAVGTGELIHYAKVFVCAMRRAARTLEALSANRSAFPEKVGDTIQVAWRKRKKMFESYREPRDAIEHIASEVPKKDAWHVLNLLGDTLHVTEDVGAEVSEKNLLSAIEAWDEIIGSVARHMSLDISVPTETDNQSEDRPKGPPDSPDSGPE